MLVVQGGEPVGGLPRPRAEPLAERGQILREGDAASGGWPQGVLE